MLGRLNGYLALLAVACSGPGKDPDTGGTDTDDTEEPDPNDEPTGDSAPDGPAFFEPAFLHVSGEFGWDAANASLVDVGTPYGAFPSRIILRYGDAAWQADSFGLDSDHYCVVEIPLTQSARAPWVNGSASYWYGFEADPNEGVFSDCNTGDGVYDLDPAAWGENFPADLAERSWGLGVGEINAEWAEYFLDGDYEAYAFGGILPNNYLPYGEEDYFALARTIDANFNVVLDGNSFVFLESTAIFQTTNIATAWYVIDTTSLWTIGRNN